MSLLIIPKSRKTVDENYKAAKKNLRLYQVSSQKYQQSMKNLASHALQLAKGYSKLSHLVTGWYPDTTPAVRQSMDSINQSATDFEKMTTESFINKIDPNFTPAMNEYQKHVESLLSLEKKRRTAVREYDREREKLRQAESSKNPDQNKIDHAQTQVDAAGETYNKLNDEYISSVQQFGEERKTTLVETFKSCCAILCKYINQATSLSFIQFPENVNSEPKAQKLQDELDSIKVLDSNNSLPTDASSSKLSQAKSATPTTQINNNPNINASFSTIQPSGNTSTEELGIIQPRQTPSPAATQLSRRISDNEYQQKRHSSSVQPVTTANLNNDNLESFPSMKQQQPRPVPAPLPIQKPAPAQNPAQNIEPQQEPEFPEPIQQPTPVQEPESIQQPTPVQEPEPIQEPTPIQEPIQQPTNNVQEPEPVQQPIPAQEPIQQPSLIQEPAQQQDLGNSSTPTNSDSVWQRRPPIPNAGNTPSIDPAFSDWYKPQNTETDSSFANQSETDSKNNSTAQEDNQEDDTYSHVNPFGSDDDDEGYTRENPFN